MDKKQAIQTEAETLLKKIINTFELSVEEDHDMYYVTIKTDEEASTVIGRHGETIRAIQKILEVILYKSLNESVNILINVNDYREKQKERLHQMAAEMADKTINSSKPTHVRGLSSYERKIMHEYITAEYPELTTYSIGEGRERHLVIDHKKDGETHSEFSETQD